MNYFGRSGTRRMVVAVVLAAALAACGSDSSSTQGSLMNVFYSASGDASVVLDSVKYDNGSGTLIKVIHPAIPWTAVLAVPSGSTVEAHLWGSIQPGNHVKLRAEWLLPGYSTTADSSTFTSANPATFSIGLPKRQI